MPPVTKGGLNDPSTVSVMAGIITALHHDQEFADAFHERFRRAEGRRGPRRSSSAPQQRGEIRDDVDLDLLEPVLAADHLCTARSSSRLPIDDATVAGSSTRS